jgi:hypothetical protein
LIIRAPSERSRDQGGTKPQRPSRTVINFSAAATIGASWVGAMLYRGTNSGTWSTTHFFFISAALAVM